MGKKIVVMLVMCFTLTGCFQTDEDCREKILSQLQDAADSASEMAKKSEQDGDFREAASWSRESFRLLSMSAQFSNNMSINENEGACSYYFDGNTVRRK